MFEIEVHATSKDYLTEHRILSLVGHHQKLLEFFEGCHSNNFMHEYATCEKLRNTDAEEREK